MKQKTSNIIACILIMIGACCLLWGTIDKAGTRGKPTFSATYRYIDWSDTETIILADLHENDIVIYEIGHMAGWIDVWMENANGEAITEASTSGKTELVVSKHGDYILRMVGDHADASVVLTIYANE